MAAEIEARIRQMLMAKTTSAGLENALFGPLGLFQKLAKTKEEREALSKTKLFQLAQARISQILRAELEAEQRRIEEICPPPDFSIEETFEDATDIASPNGPIAPKTPTAS